MLSRLATKWKRSKCFCESDKKYLENLRQSLSLATIVCHQLLRGLSEQGKWDIQRSWNHDNVHFWGIHLRTSGLLIKHCFYHSYQDFQEGHHSCHRRCQDEAQALGRGLACSSHVMLATAIMTGGKWTAGWGCPQSTHHQKSLEEFLIKVLLRSGEKISSPQDNRTPGFYRSSHERIRAPLGNNGSPCLVVPFLITGVISPWRQWENLPPSQILS